MTPGEVADFLATLPGCTQTGTRAIPAWYVAGRVVARLVAADELMIRCDFAERERLVRDDPETFGIPPEYEAHMKVQAMLAGDADRIRSALRGAWELQRKR
ncbi:hypothetical protein [Flexivirga oryzae]|uniref:MmcQ/YjbR family DNA-binding protein n=1 Tax=Flexivirga oryzae TaxID=1794944 RepID=A0A839N7U0_9MICO|nr:hypothetical protein [Flexivirga oryzae]MBB2890811.1 hypothetical protein [Flexivirga oryzae]